MCPEANRLIHDQRILFLMSPEEIRRPPARRPPSACTPWRS
ncbi:hypothetical protein BN940_01811 [Castellaniella defragrans 65Phen]|uniref:Uncharacterized protein n=1 Tax=Castellaniella defragrans (strain DSM 12143 / CCUG 39792 / 65Phen) TaxID=1437824 RepID=W8WT13_CASD6|nr:hypothetical protein BN940_01811 [Castellaniella defragrans 65Phen]